MIVYRIKSSVVINVLSLSSFLNQCEIHIEEKTAKHNITYYTHKSIHSYEIRDTILFR